MTDRLAGRGSGSFRGQKEGKARLKGSSPRALAGIDGMGGARVAGTARRTLMRGCLGTMWGQHLGRGWEDGRTFSALVDVAPCATRVGSAGAAADGEGDLRLQRRQKGRRVRTLNPAHETAHWRGYLEAQTKSACGWISTDGQAEWK